MLDLWVFKQKIVSGEIKKVRQFKVKYLEQFLAHGKRLRTVSYY